MFSLYRWKRVRKFPTKRTRFWNALASWKHFRKSKQLPLHLQKLVACMEKCGESEEIISLIENKGEKKKTDIVYVECMLKLMNGRTQAILEDQVQINWVQSVNGKLAALMRTVQEPKETKIEGNKTWIPRESNPERIKHYRWQRETTMACCQGNCFSFVLLCFLLYFVLSFQGQKIGGGGGS